MVKKDKITPKFGILTLHLSKRMDSIISTYQPVGEYFSQSRGCFAARWNSKILVGGGRDKFGKNLNEVFELAGNDELYEAEKKAHEETKADVG